MIIVAYDLLEPLFYRMRPDADIGGWQVEILDMWGKIVAQHHEPTINSARGRIVGLDAQPFDAPPSENRPY